MKALVDEVDPSTQRALSSLRKGSPVSRRAIEDRVGSSAARKV